MKQIIDGKLYDTEKMKELYVGEYPNPTFWKSEKGTILRRGYRAMDDDYLHIINEEYLKEYLATTDPEVYIAIYGEVEEG